MSHKKMVTMGMVINGVYYIKEPSISNFNFKKKIGYFQKRTKGYKK